MPNYNTIMAALAFSPYTEGILTYTADLARQLDANLLVCSVINHRDVNAIKRIVQLGYEVDSDHYVRGVQAERRQILDPLIEKLGLERQRIKTVFKIGNPVHEIIQTALDHHVEMIVDNEQLFGRCTCHVGNSPCEHQVSALLAWLTEPATFVSYQTLRKAIKLKDKNALVDVLINLCEAFPDLSRLFVISPGVDELETIQEDVADIFDFPHTELEHLLQM